jgi:hypothetical protein
MPTAKTKWQTDQQLFMGLVAGSNLLVNAMADSPKPGSGDPIRCILQRGTALPEQTLQDALTRAFDKGRQLSRSVGITETVITQASAPARVSLVSPTVQPKSPKNQPDGPKTVPPIQARPLETLQQFQTSLLAAKDLNSLLSVLVNTLHTGGGFSRVALALLNPGDTDQLLGRVVVGVDSPDRYLASFAGSLSTEHTLFLHVLKQQDPFLLSEVSPDGPRSLSSRFLTTWQTSTAILAPIRIGIRPIGLLYSDRGPHPGQVSSQDLQALQLFFGQAVLSLNRLAGVL